MASKGCAHKIIPIKPVKAIKVFEKLGFTQYPNSKGGSHITMKRNPTDPDFFILVKHGSKVIKPEAIKAMLKNGKIAKKQYLDVFNSI